MIARRNGRASSAFFLAASAASACFFFSSSALSVPVAEALAAAACGVADAGAVAAAATGTLAPRGCARMFLAGTSAGGARSLNTRRPSLSIHWYCARAGTLAASRAQTMKRRAGFMGYIV